MLFFKCYYISADQIYFSRHSLIEVAERFNKMGGTNLIIDEVHKYPSWSVELKEIYDTYDDMQVIFSGSSVLDIYRGMGDLSRRAPVYEMQGLSFREYLKMYHDIDVPIATLDNVLKNEIEIGRIKHILPYFKDYLERGYYPFGRDVDFAMELMQVVGKTMEADIPQYASLSVATGRKLQKLLMVIAESVPFKPQLVTLASQTGISRNDIADLLLYMERAGMIARLLSPTQGVRSLGKVDKLYLDNTNLAYILAEKEPNVGNLRETFFYNQTRIVGKVTSSELADFELEGHTFEVGGHAKSKRQIADARDGYVVKDDIEFGYGNVLPLWAFGLLY